MSPAPSDDPVRTPYRAANRVRGGRDPGVPGVPAVDRRGPLVENRGHGRPERRRDLAKPGRGWPGTRRWSGTASPRWRRTPETSPLVIERAEGRELIDVAGRRYLDAISSLWVNTLGHRVPELDAALVDQVGKVAHSTMLGNGNTVVVELAEALAAVVPVDGPHFLFAADGAVAVEQALKIAFQYWVNRASPQRSGFLALGGRVPRGHGRGPVGRRRWLLHRGLRPPLLPGPAHPGL